MSNMSCILKELQLIRKELQSINNKLEHNSEISFDGNDFARCVQKAIRNTAQATSNPCRKCNEITRETEMEIRKWINC